MSDCPHCRVRDVSGWNAFDAPTQDWLRQRLAQPELIDCFGERIEMQMGDDALLHLVRVAAMRDRQIAGRSGLALDVVRARLMALENVGLVRRDESGFWEAAA